MIFLIPFHLYCHINEDQIFLAIKGSVLYTDVCKRRNKDFEH